MQNSPDLLTSALQNPTLREAELGRRGGGRWRWPGRGPVAARPLGVRGALGELPHSTKVEIASRKPLVVARETLRPPAARSPCGPKHAFPGVKTVHPPSRIAEWGKTAGQKS